MLLLAYFVNHKPEYILPCSQCRQVKHSSWATQMKLCFNARLAGMWNGPYGSQPPSSSQQQPPPPPPPTSQYPAMAAIGAPAAAAASAAASAAATAAASASQKEQAKAQQEQQRLRAFRELAVYAAQLQLQMASDQLAEAASSEMERLLEVQRTLSEHDQRLQRVVSGAACCWQQPC